MQGVDGMAPGSGEGRSILGVSAGFHDAAAALVVDGRVLAAVEEERLSRRKHDASFPRRAMDTCLAIAGMEPGDVDVVAFHEKPVDVIGRHLASRIHSGPAAWRGLLLDTPRVLSKQLTVGQQVERWFRERSTPAPPVCFVEHHASHAAAAFYPSPFTAAAVLTEDGVGERATATLGCGIGSRLRIDRELWFPDSLGLLYSAFTAYCGMRVNGGEGELMGLAPFGEPVHADVIMEEVVELGEDGSFRLNPRYFDFVHGDAMTSPRFHRRFGGDPRPLGAPPTRREADLAASVQFVTEEVLLRMAGELHRLTGLDALCLGGGVALNCVANARLAREGPFGDVWVQPAAGDAGNALGAALWVWHEVLDGPREAVDGDGMSGAFLGPEFHEDEIRDWLDAEGIPYVHGSDPERVADEVAARLDDGALVGWFAGRMEFGPRALGHRSILADPRSPTVQGRLNGVVKERAPFRPFAPAALEDAAAEWFDTLGPTPYMTFTVPAAPSHWVDAEVADTGDDLAAAVAEVRTTIPAVTHVDRSARLQTVDRDRNPEFTRVLEAFERRTGCPVLLNTSFNSRDEPIVCSPEDAYRTFRNIGLDLLALGPFLIEQT